MSPCALTDQLECPIQGDRLFVDTLAADRIKHIYHCHDTCAKRDLLPGQSHRIAASIPSLMMVKCHMLRDLEIFTILHADQDRLDNIGSFLGM